MSGQTSTPETITCEEARTRLGMGRDAFRQAVREGWVIGFFHSGDRYYGVRAQFDAWMAGRATHLVTEAEPASPTVTLDAPPHLTVLHRRVS